MKRTLGWAGLALCCGLVLACNSAEDLSQLCIPTVDCSAIHAIETPANCTTCLTCQDNWGTCDPEGAVCKRGALDLDANTPGCESTTSDARDRAQWVLHSTGDTVSSFKFNGGLFTVPMSVSALAFDQDDPSCVPTITVKCPITVRAMELEISDFKIPESSWSGGVATLKGPFKATDNGGGVLVDASLLFAFDVREAATRRVALSAAHGQFGFTATDLPRSNIVLEVSSIDFGGYQITDLSLSSELTNE